MQIEESCNTEMAERSRVAKRYMALVYTIGKGF